MKFSFVKHTCVLEHIVLDVGTLWALDFSAMHPNCPCMFRVDKKYSQ